MEPTSKSTAGSARRESKRARPSRADGGYRLAPQSRYAQPGPRRRGLCSLSSELLKAISDFVRAKTVSATKLRIIFAVLGGIVAWSGLAAAADVYLAAQSVESRISVAYGLPTGVPCWRVCEDEIDSCYAEAREMIDQGHTKETYEELEETCRNQYTSCSSQCDSERSRR
jgi:hypothetical protein